MNLGGDGACTGHLSFGRLLVPGAVQSTIVIAMSIAFPTLDDNNNKQTRDKNMAHKDMANAW